jgi:hypothetical protein
MIRQSGHVKPATQLNGIVSGLHWFPTVACQLKVRMWLFRLGLAFKTEKLSGRILKLTATAK